ncbi:MAG: hypothetical protein OXH57_09110 [Ekhidna sp.]|nr:hypothetical protein [Ekhidna sp.]
MEKNCKWHFDESGQAKTGPNDSIHETFKANPYYSIVRESIQNSLDAALNDDEPVKISFEFSKLIKNDYPNLFDIKKHIIACWQTHKKDKQAEKLFQPMSSYLDKNTEIEILKISDYNTKGMDNSGFSSFVRFEGKSSKSSEGSGGSFGFGKGAYYALSKIKTIIVSTKTDRGNVYFEGRTRLATHELDKKVYARDGFYNLDYENPVSHSDNIPNFFKRSENGTDIYIIGLIKSENSENRKEQMIKSVLNNFWLAVYEKKLIVTVDYVKIDFDNLQQIIDYHFPAEVEQSAEPEHWNPSPYFKAVKYAGSNEQYLVFPENLPTLGNVKLYVYLNKGLPNRTCYLRNPKMVVYKGRRRNLINGYVAVFVCDEEPGNTILKEMENPAHNEWKKENYKDEDDEVHTDADNAENELRQFVNETLKKLSKSKIGESALVPGLEEYLYSTEELLEKYEEQQMQGSSPSSTSGQLNDEVIDEETGLQTTEIENPPARIELKRTDLQEIKEDEVMVEPDEDGGDKVTIGGENEAGGGDKQGQGDSGADTGINKNTNKGGKLLLEVILRVVAQQEDEQLYHSLIINSPRDVQKAEIELMVGADNERDDGISLVTTNNGNIDNNVLNCVQLSKGRNIVKVSFSDNVKHSIKVKAYEIQ